MFMNHELLERILFCTKVNIDIRMKTLETSFVLISDGFRLKFTRMKLVFNDFGTRVISFKMKLYFLWFTRRICLTLMRIPEIG